MDAAIDRDEAKDIRAGEDENVRLPLLEEEEEVADEVNVEDIGGKLSTKH